VSGRVIGVGDRDASAVTGRHQVAARIISVVDRLREEAGLHEQGKKQCSGHGMRTSEIYQYIAIATNAEALANFILVIAR
jgi:hypothetical protein